jgi:hypothetical protein
MAWIEAGKLSGLGRTGIITDGCVPTAISLVSGVVPSNKVIVLSARCLDSGVRGDDGETISETDGRLPEPSRTLRELYRTCKGEEGVVVCCVKSSISSCVHRT